MSPLRRHIKAWEQCRLKMTDDDSRAWCDRKIGRLMAKLAALPPCGLVVCHAKDIDAVLALFPGKPKRDPLLRFV